MNVDQTTSGAADSARSTESGNGISRRDSLTLAAAGLTASLLPAISFAETKKESSPMSYIKVGQENSAQRVCCPARRDYPYALGDRARGRLRANQRTNAEGSAT